uniref:DUF223 domain-containing protein n=2 Tax=Oryza TaxID=4527 RepID=A0A0D3EZ14_9ORYZ
MEKKSSMAPCDITQFQLLIFGIRSNYMQYYSSANNMAPDNLIIALTPKNDRWKIKVKVIRLWDAVNPTMADDFYGIQMIVLDAEGNSIRVKVK